ncbi:hypothetical protein UMC2_08411 [[Clostridium] sordellii]|uniref:hypothetical protein n=1 Tax=Paraclostridium sordellii TaxID=1505 RepID=UPI000543C182|nr:hypothetical protein [Paeniclostridium sordellii]CEK33591.1 hypothetical protein UMC2_08411 [[Clostridium] sordellii] [Paeniclostridium sordellii]
MNNPTIDQYLISTSLFIIDEFNEKYNLIRNNKTELKKIADEQFNEMDICVRVGYPFRNMVHYTVGDSKKDKCKSNHDLYIESKYFKIEIKYLKNWKSENGTYSASKTWKEYQADFDWLEEEIKENKGKRAFIIGWFNCVDKFSQLVQLGSGKGSKPLVDEHKFVYFPFLRKLRSPAITTDLEYDYTVAYKSERLKSIGIEKSNIDYMFLGNENDVFHFAIYY